MELNAVVNAFTNSVIFGPTLFQLITSYIFCIPTFIISAIVKPSPFQSLLINAFLILAAHLLIGVSSTVKTSSSESCIPAKLSAKSPSPEPRLLDAVPELSELSVS